MRRVDDSLDLALSTEADIKQCSRCKCGRERSEFCNDKRRSDGKHPWCKKCMQSSRRVYAARPDAKERMRAYGTEWSRRPENKAKRLAYQKTAAGKAVKRRTKMKAKYGLTEERLRELLSFQDGVCGVCRAEFTSSKHTHVDHCHKTGRVRGVLCNDCNRALGAAKDDPGILRQLALYLERHQ